MDDDRLARIRHVAAPRIVSVQEMRALEAAARAAGRTEETLQANAAQALAELSEALVPPDPRRPVVVLVGPGNNGRDAMLAGRHLARRGFQVCIYLGPRHAVEPPELASLERAGAAVAHHVDGDAGTLAALTSWLDRAALALDGLLGVGARGALRSPLDALARELNQARTRRRGALRVLAVDIPSGVDADLGQVEGVAVEADVTAALGAVKAGTLRFPAARFTGRLVCLPIGLPPDVDDRTQPRLLDRSGPIGALPPRDPAGHKGSFGKVLVVGGSRLYLGAPVLSGLAAARGGCGLVILCAPLAVQTVAASIVPEATYAAPIDPEQDPRGALHAVREAAASADALVLGPGLGRSDGAAHLVRELLGEAGSAPLPPTVVDADALNALARWDGWWKSVATPLVLTPHHVEMSRLTGADPGDVARDNWVAARGAALAWAQCVVLKGPHTSVASGDGRVVVYPRANPALATAGSGDVLAGLIASLLAQGLDRWGAATLGVLAHARAARAAIRDTRGRTVLASDVARALPVVLAKLATPSDARD